MKQFTYLLINICTVLPCLIFSFHQAIRFNKHFVSFMKACTLVAIPFITWDILFTNAGVWWFNEDYVLGWKLINLPLEECLFFFCIPFACVFTYYCLYRFFQLQWANAFNNLIVYTCCIVFFFAALLYHDKLYTFVTMLATGAILLYLHFISKADWIGKATLTYIFLLPGFLLVNGLLTGTGLDAPVVNYRPSEFIGKRIISIPIEDTVYGYGLFLLNIYFFERFRRRAYMQEAQ